MACLPLGNLEWLIAMRYCETLSVSILMAMQRMKLLTIQAGQWPSRNEIRYSKQGAAAPRVKQAPSAPVPLARPRQLASRREQIPDQPHLPRRARRDGGAQQPRRAGVDARPGLSQLLDFSRHADAVEKLGIRLEAWVDHPFSPVAPCCRYRRSVHDDRLSARSRRLCRPAA